MAVVINITTVNTVANSFLILSFMKRTLVDVWFYTSLLLTKAGGLALEESRQPAGLTVHEDSCAIVKMARD